MIVEVVLNDTQKAIIEALGCILRAESDIVCCDTNPWIISKIVYYIMPQAYLDGFMFYDVPKRNVLGVRLGAKMNDDGVFLLRLDLVSRVSNSVYLDGDEVFMFEKLVNNL